VRGTKDAKTNVKVLTVTPELLQQINTFTIEPVTADQVFVFKTMMAHNGIDRDNERFSEELLEDFASTFVGKSFLFGHKRDVPGKGIFYSAYTEVMTAEQFRLLTGEAIILPSSINKATTLWAYAYLLNNAHNDELIANIKAGIYRFVSIGFNAADLNVQNVVPRYWEYSAPGEALEGSLVWLGAQQGATTQKQHDFDKDIKMDLKAFGEILGKEVTAETVVDVVKQKLTEKDRLIAALEKSAADGKIYRKGMIDEYVSLRAKLKEVGNTPEEQGSLRKMAESYTVDFLSFEIKLLKERVEKTYPASGQVKGAAFESRDGGTDNPLIPKN
jgi:hypothetical protein